MRVAALFSLVIFAQGCPEPPPAFCGDGALNAGEGCDDGNDIDADGCEANCTLPACGNGIVDPGEVCLVGPLNLVTDQAPLGIVAADLNGDGALDLATANGAGESLSLLLGTGDGHFSRGTDAPLLGAASPLVVNDFNGDGALDLATALITGPSTIPVLRGDSLGGFSLLAALPTSLATFSLVTGDFNDDTLPDLATGDAAGAGVSLFLNSGEGGFEAPRLLAEDASISALEAGDFDGDGALDLAAAIDLAAGIMILRNDGSGGFSALPTQDFAAAKLVQGDFDGDGVLDLVMTQRLGNDVVPLLGNGDGSFTPAPAATVGASISQTVADLNRDGSLDLALVLPADIFDPELNAHLAVVLGDGAGGFSPLPLLPMGFSDSRGVVVGDFNSDTLPDVALSDQANARVQVFLSQP